MALELILSDDSVDLKIEIITELVAKERETIIDSIELVPNLNIYDELFLNQGEKKHEGCYQ